MILSYLVYRVGLVEAKGFVAELAPPHVQSVWESKGKRITIRTVRLVCTVLICAPILKLQHFVLI